MPAQMVNDILSWFPPRKPKLILLGGEPTLYPSLERLISYANNTGFKYIRLETNGGKSYFNFIDANRDLSLTKVAFSIDGHNESTYSLTRGDNNFSDLLRSIELTRMLGIRYYAILSVSRVNIATVPRIIEFCADLGCERVTVHYVTPRGDSEDEIEVKPDEWKSCFARLQEIVFDKKIPVRWEETFRQLDSRQNNIAFECASKSYENVMVMPNGITFLCTLFLDRPDLSGYMWNKTSFEQRSAMTEIDICRDSSQGCPGFSFTRTKIKLGDLTPICAFRKIKINP